MHKGGGTYLRDSTVIVIIHWTPHFPNSQTLVYTHKITLLCKVLCTALIEHSCTSVLRHEYTN